MAKGKKSTNAPAKKKAVKKVAKKVAVKTKAQRTEYKYRISPQQVVASNEADADSPSEIALLGKDRQPTEDSGLLYQAIIDAGDPTATPPTHVLKVDRSQGTSTTGPLNSYVVIPRAYNKFFYQGNGNGMVVGNKICPKNITMKMTVDFEGLRRNISMVGAGDLGEPDSFRIQSYKIMCRQGWIKRNTRSLCLSSSNLNAESGQQLPAMPLHSDAGEASYDTTEVHKYNIDMLMAKEVLYEEGLQVPYLSFQGPRKKSEYLELRKFEIKPKLDDRWTANSQPTNQGEGEPRQQTIVGQNVTRPQNFKFTWSFPEGHKQQLYPIVKEGNEGKGVLAGSAVRASFGWIPIVMVSVERERDENMEETPNDHEPNNDYRSYIQVKTVSKFTFTDS